MFITSEIIPSLRKTEKNVNKQLTEATISGIKLYKNKHYISKKQDSFNDGINNFDDQFSFKLVGVSDSIVYASSNTDDSGFEPPVRIDFSGDKSPIIPLDKLKDNFYIAYFKNDSEITRFPQFSLDDITEKFISGATKELKQISVDGGMMIYILFNFIYEDQIMMTNAKPVS